MKLKILDKTFFSYFKVCPTKALYSFNMDYAVGSGKACTKVDKNKEAYKNELILKILKISILTLDKNGTLNYKDFENILKVELKEAWKKKENQLLESKQQSNSSLTIKEKIITNIEENLAQQIFDLITPRDFENIKKKLLSDFKELNKIIEKPSNSFSILGTNYKLKKKYFYNYDIPFITEESGQHTLVTFTESGIPNVFEEFDFDLAITLWVAKELFPNYIFKDIIVYDIKTLKRTVLNINEIRIEFLLEDLFKRFVMIDSGMQFKNFGEHCEECMNNSACYSTLIKDDIFTKIFNSKIKGKNLDELKKQKVLRDTMKYHAKKTK